MRLPRRAAGASGGFSPLSTPGAWDTAARSVRQGHGPAAPVPLPQGPVGRKHADSSASPFSLKTETKIDPHRTWLLFHALSRRVTLGRGPGPEWGWGLLPGNPERSVPGAWPWPLSRDGRALHGAPFSPERRLRPTPQRPACRSHLKQTVRLRQEAGRRRPPSVSLGGGHFLLPRGQHLVEGIPADGCPGTERGRRLRKGGDPRARALPAQGPQWPSPCQPPAVSTQQLRRHVVEMTGRRGCSQGRMGRSSQPRSNSARRACGSDRDGSWHSSGQ